MFHSEQGNINFYLSFCLKNERTAPSQTSVHRNQGDKGSHSVPTQRKCHGVLGPWWHGTKYCYLGTVLVFLYIFLFLGGATEVRDCLKFPLTFPSVPGRQRCAKERNIKLQPWLRPLKESGSCRKQRQIEPRTLRNDPGSSDLSES